MNGGAQARAFYREVAKGRGVWTIGDARSLLTVEVTGGVRVLPLWSSRYRAEMIVATVAGYAEAKVLGASWDSFVSDTVPSLEESGTLVGPNWGGANASGYEMPAGRLVELVRAAIASAT